MLRTLRTACERIHDIAVLRWRDSLFSSYWKDKKQVVLIMQMGKVASSSLYSTVRDKPGFAVFQFHRTAVFSQNTVGHALRRGYQRVRALPHELIGLLVKRNLPSLGMPIKLIITIREPVSRNLSAYFHNRAHFRSAEEAEEGPAPIRIKKAFLRSYPHDLPDSWFEAELRPLTGIDVFAHPFDQELGYGMIKANGFELLLMHHDLPEAEMSKVLGRFLGTSLESIRKENVGDNKVYSGEYRDFKRSAKLPAPYLLGALNTRFARHFYTVSYRQRIFMTWTEPGSGGMDEIW